MMKCDILIIGSGIAGLSYAVKVAEKRKDLNIVLLTKEKITTSNTELAQGGIAAVMNLVTDSFEKHIQDTMDAGGGLSDLKIVKHVVESAPKRLKELIDYGVEFCEDTTGNLELGLEGGHQVNRIVHAKDQTGSKVEEILCEKIKTYKNITIHTHFCAVDLIYNHESIVGTKVLDLKSKVVKVFLSKITVLATGGSGQVYKYTTNPTVATGDGVAMANRVGVKISNMHYFQFHPTAFMESEMNPLFLISEAVRGFGAFIINEKDERFIFKSDSRGELATRDIVSKAIIEELKGSNQSEVYLDCRHLDSNIFKIKFPFISNYCESKGYNLKNDLLPIIPAAHYQCGGIEVDEKGRTSIYNLFAIGECANTGLHGKNRLASNSLLEALVFAHDAAIETLKIIDLITLHFSETTEVIMLMNEKEEIYRNYKLKIQEIMSNQCSFGSEKKEVLLANSALNLLKQEFLKNYEPRKLTVNSIETINLFDVALLISNAIAKNLE